MRNNTERVYDKSTQWPLSRVFYNLRVKKPMSIAHTSIKLENMLFALPQILNPKYAKAKDISRQMLKYCAVSNIKKISVSFCYKRHFAYRCNQGPSNHIQHFYCF